MDLILLFDTQLFLFTNHLPHWEIMNLLAQFLSGVGTAGIIWFILAAILFLKEEKKDHWFFLPVLFSGGISWVLVEKIMKPLVGRVRPSAEMGAIIVGAINGDFSFPSGHATIAWAMAVVLSKKEPKAKWMFYVLAILISLSRIYLGKHFPLDVISGALLGWGIGLASLTASHFFQKKLRRRK